MPAAADVDVVAEIRRLLREVAPQVLGIVVRRYRDFAACEDAVQEAFIAAAASVIYWDGRHNNWEAGPRPTPWPVSAVEG